MMVEQYEILHKMFGNSLLVPSHEIIFVQIYHILLMVEFKNLVKHFMNTAHFNIAQPDFICMKGAVKILIIVFCYRVQKNLKTQTKKVITNIKDKNLLSRAKEFLSQVFNV